MALSTDMLQLVAAFSGERWQGEFITDRMAVHLTEEIIKKLPNCQMIMGFLIGCSGSNGRLTAPNHRITKYLKARWPGPPIGLASHVVYVRNLMDFLVFFPSALRQTCKLLSKSSWTPIIQEFRPDNCFVVGDGLLFADSSIRRLDRRLERIPAEDRVAVRGLIMAKQRAFPLSFILGVKRGYEGTREVTAKRLKLAGYTSKDLHQAGCSKQELLDAGWSRRTINNLADCDYLQYLRPFGHQRFPGMHPQAGWHGRCS